MDLKKRKHFTTKKEDNFFFFFAFQTRKDLQCGSSMFFDKWLGGIYTLYKQGRKNSSVYNVCCTFEDNYIFGANFNTSFWSYQPIP